MIRDLEIIRELQLINLQSLKKLDEICKKHRIQYWVAYGSLLGTIRHKGFIPWDDDLDICMMREDFDRLCDVPEEEWGEEFTFCSPYSSDERHDKYFGRIYVNKTRIQSYVDVKSWRRWSDNKSWYTSVLCDIFVWDHVPSDYEDYKKRFDQILKYRKLYQAVKLKPYSDAAGLKQKLKVKVKLFYSYIMRKIYRKPWAVMYDKSFPVMGKGSDFSRIGTYCTADNFLYDYDDIFPLSTGSFEGMEVPIPRNYQKMLTDMYGDYMEFPPENERWHLNLIYLDLGEDKKYIIDPIEGSLGAEEKKGRKLD